MQSISQEPNTLKEKESYKYLSSWLPENYDVDDNLLWTDAQINYGSIKARSDVIAYYLEIDEKETPPCKEITGIHIIECKRDWAAFQAYGQLLFYKEIVDRYLRSKHYEAFNKDYYDGASKYFQRKGSLPFGWKYSLRLANELDLWLHLALLETGYTDSSFFKFVEGSLDDLLEGNVGLLVLTKHGTRLRVKERKEPKPLRLTRKRGPRPKNWIETFAGNILYPTRLRCRRFGRDGKRNYWCHEINPQECEGCPFYAGV